MVGDESREVALTQILEMQFADIQGSVDIIWATDLAFLLFSLIIFMFFKGHAQQIDPQAS